MRKLSRINPYGIYFIDKIIVFCYNSLNIKGYESFFTTTKVAFAVRLKRFRDFFIFGEIFYAHGRCFIITRNRRIYVGGYSRG